MKKISLIYVLAFLFCFLSCNQNDSSLETDNSETNTVKKNKVVKIAHVGESDNAIWKPVIEKLAEENIIVELLDFYDYSIPNKALNHGDVDLNAFQHYAYFNDEVRKHGYKITPIADTYISAMNIYSTKITNINQIEHGDKILIPEDPSNIGRALKVLQAAGIIKLREDVGDFPVTNDIIENNLNVEIIEMYPGDIYGELHDAVCAVINANYAIDFGFNPGNDYIFKDDPSIYSGKSFVNLIAARTKDKDNELYKKVVEAYQSEEVEKVYAEDFQGAYLPAWK